MSKIRRDIKARIGTGPMAETVEKVMAELILKASIARAKRLRKPADIELEAVKK